MDGAWSRRLFLGRGGAKRRLFVISRRGCCVGDSGWRSLGPERCPRSPIGGAGDLDAVCWIAVSVTQETFEVGAA